MEILDEGFSQKGELTEKEELEVRLLKTDVKFAFKELKQGRIALFVVSGLFLLGMIISSQSLLADPLEIFIEGAFFFLGTFFAAFSVPKKPYVAMSVGAGLYLLNLTLSAIGNPTAIFSGIIFKIALIYFLAKGVIGAKDYLKVAEKLKKYGEEVPPEYKFKNA